MYVSMWEFQVKKGSEAEFERLYGSDGPWVKLFQNDEGYIKTELLQNMYQPTRYVIVEYWSSKEACVTFRNAYSTEFASLDKRGELLTEKKTLLGEFELIED